MIIIIVGDEKKFDKPLASVGKVKTIDLAALQAADQGGQK